MQWSTKERTLQRTANVADNTLALIRSRDGRTLIVSDRWNTKSTGVHLINAGNLASTLTIRAFAYDRWLAYRPDGTCAASPRTAAAVVPDFIIRPDGIVKTRRRCPSTDLAAMLPD